MASALALALCEARRERGAERALRLAGGALEICDVWHTAWQARAHALTLLGRRDEAVHAAREVMANAPPGSEQGALADDLAFLLDP